jgi:hypothetical protein
MKPLRFASLIVAGALAVHELRYLVGGHGVGAAGHGYLPLAGLAAALLAAAACAQLLARVTRARRTGLEDPREIGFRQAWLVASLSIAAAFFAQELLEGLIAGGRASGLGPVLEAGGWVALPAAVAVGALVAVAIVGARAVVAAAARRAPRSLRARPRKPSRRPLAPGHRRVADVIATNLAGRAPPLVA